MGWSSCSSRHRRGRDWRRAVREHGCALSAECVNYLHNNAVAACDARSGLGGLGGGVLSGRHGSCREVEFVAISAIGCSLSNEGVCRRISSGGCGKKDRCPEWEGHLICSGERSERRVNAGLRLLRHRPTGQPETNDRLPCFGGSHVRWRSLILFLSIVVFEKEGFVGNVRDHVTSS